VLTGRETATQPRRSRVISTKPPAIHSGQSGTAIPETASVDALSAVKVAGQQPAAVAGPLVVLVGAPGSGKSTWARRHFPKDQIVSLDEIRRVVSGDPNNQDATHWAVQARNALVQGRMRFGLPTVVDATNADPEQRAEIAGMRFTHPRSAAGRWLPAIAIIFDTPLDECLARNA